MAEGTVQLAEWLFTDLLTRNELDTYILIKVPASCCLHSYRRAMPAFPKILRPVLGVGQENGREKEGEGRGMDRNYSVHNTIRCDAMQRCERNLRCSYVRIEARKQARFCGTVLIKLVA